MEDELSRSAASDSFDDDEDFLNDDGQDDEATLDEEEALEELTAAGATDELKDLDEDAGLSIEELRRKYGYGSSPTPVVEDSGPIPAKRRRTERVIQEDSKPTEVNEDQACSSQNDNSAECASSSDSTGVLFGVNFNIEEDEDEQEDKDYEPKREGVIRVSPDFQATIPEYDPTATVSDYGMTTLWIPSKTLGDDELNNFIVDCLTIRANKLSFTNVEVKKPAVIETVRDDEDSLFTLLSFEYNTRDAVKSFESFPRIAYANSPKLTVPPLYGNIQYSDRSWTETDVERFEMGLKEFGKNFVYIQGKYLPNRHVGELVEFYYGWKKTERYDIFRERLHQKDPHCTDYMQQVCEQMGDRAGDGAAKKYHSYEEVAHG